MPKTPKWRLVLVLFIVSIVALVAGVNTHFYHVIIPALILLFLAIGVMVFGDRKEKSYIALIIEGVLFGLV